MADFTLSIKIGASVSASTLSTLQTLKQELKTLKLSSEEVGKTFPEQWKGDFTSFRTYASTVNALVKKLKELKREGKENTRAFYQLQTALKRLGVNTQYLEEEIKRLSYTLRKLKSASKVDLKIQLEKENLRSQISSLKSALAVGASLALPIKLGMDFEAQIVRVKALANATEKEFIALKEKAKELGSSTRFSATEVAQAFEYMAMAGMKTEDILTSAGDVLNLAVIGNLDLARASDIATNIMSGFALEAEELSRVIDVMAKTITTSNTSVEELGETMKYVAPVASSLGASLQEVSAMAGILGNVGIKGSQAGTVLRAMFLRLSAPTDEAGKALQALGITTTDTYGRLKPMPQLLKELANAMEMLPQAQRMEYLKAIFGEEPAAGVQALLEAAKKGELQRYISELENSQGSAKKMIGDLNKTLRASITSLLSALQTLAIEIFEPMKPYVKGFIDLLTLGVKTLTLALKPVLPVLAPALFLLGSLFVATKLLTIATTAFRLAQLLLSRELLLTQARVSATTAGLKLFKAQTLLASAGIKTLTKALLFNPFGIILLGATLLLGHLDKVKSFLKGVLSALKETFSIFSPLISPVVAGIRKLANLLRFAESSTGNLNSAFENIGYTVGRLLVPLSLLALPLLKGIALFKRLKQSILNVPPLSLKIKLPDPLKFAQGFISRMRDFFKKGLSLPFKFPFLRGAGLLLRGLGIFSPVGLGVSFLLPHIPKIFEGVKNLSSGIWSFVKKGASFLVKTSPVGLLASALSSVKEKVKGATKETGKEALVESSKEVVKEKLVKEEKPRISVNIGSINLTVNVPSKADIPKTLQSNLKTLIKETVIEALEEEERKLNLALPPT